MSNLDKDIHQKESAIRFCILTGSVPFLEVNVENKKELSDTSTVITDIDVLGVYTDSTGVQRRTIFDCKTLGKTSPINRAFWAAGLMRYLACDEAFVILRKKSSEAHRLSAKHIDVHLFDENQFANFAESYSLEFKSDYCYSTSIDVWIAHASAYGKDGGFEKFGHFLNCELPLEMDAARGIKRLLAALQKGKGEFNPEKKAHIAIFQHSIMMFSFLMARIVHDLKTIIDFDANKNDFEKILKYYIWGGREAYSQRQKMIQLFSSANQSSAILAPELREWDSFVELNRKLLDSPVDVFKCCFPMREIYFRNLSPIEESKDRFVAKLIASNKRLRQFIMSQARYLAGASQLPREFNECLNEVFDQLNAKI